MPFSIADIVDILAEVEAAGEKIIKPTKRLMFSVGIPGPLPTLTGIYKITTFTP